MGAGRSTAISTRALLVVAFFASAGLVLPPGAGAAREAGPHWKREACSSCHVSSEPAVGAAGPEDMPGHAVCGTCHNARDATICRHRSGIVADASGFDAGLKDALEDRKVVCTTCHDMTPHCALDVRQRYRNPSFLRGGPFEDRGDQCFGCHAKRGYRQPSPHMQVKRGQVREGHCMFCHTSMPQKDASGRWLPVQFGTDENLSKLCTGCHAIGPHPSSSISGKTGWIHMVVPPAEYARRMQESVEVRGGHLPLDPGSGEIMCATCHNPHDPRLEGYPSADEDDTEVRLRYSHMCGVCHDK